MPMAATKIPPAKRTPNAISSSRRNGVTGGILRNLGQVESEPIPGRSGSTDAKVLTREFERVWPEGTDPSV
jgi:hypothetical protein